VNLAPFVRRGMQRAGLALGRALLSAADRIAMPVVAASDFSHEEQTLLRRNRRFRGMHSGRRAFVIGNGPSLAGQDLARLATEVTFVTNSFFLHSSLDRWCPTYYAVIDPWLLEDSEEARGYFQQIASRAPSSTFFLPLFFHRPLPSRRLVEERGFLPAEQTHFLVLDGDVSLPRLLDVDPAARLPPLLNVVQTCMMLALYMGVSEIILLGVDHDWLARPGENVHFYAQAADFEDAVIKGWMPPPSQYKCQTEVQILVWRGYECLADLARARGVRILNAAPNSYLDVFESVAFEGLLSAR